MVTPQTRVWVGIVCCGDPQLLLPSLLPLTRPTLRTTDRCLIDGAITQLPSPSLPVPVTLRSPRLSRTISHQCSTVIHGEGVPKATGQFADRQFSLWWHVHNVVRLLQAKV